MARKSPKSSRQPDAASASVKPKKAREAEEEVLSADSAEEDDESERDESTKGVAKALGVDDDDDEAAEEEAEAEAAEEEAKAAAPPNRAARRREDALRRRALREGKELPPARAAAEEEEEEEEEEASADGDADPEEEAEEDAPPKKKKRKAVVDEIVVAARDPLPKDRNARAKELLRRRQESAKLGSSNTIGLSAGEVVQDQLARAASGTTRWLRSNLKYVVGGVAVALAGAAGVFFYLDYQAKERAKASDALMAAVVLERAEIVPEGETPPPDLNDGTRDPSQTATYASYGARADAELAAYQKVIDAHPKSGAAVLARMGKAGAQLEKGDFDAALSAYGEVLESELAKADVDVRARAMEGKGFAQEGKKDYDGALATFRELANVDKGFEDLANYHQGRMHLKKGDKDKAKEVLLAVYKKVEVPTTDGPQQRFLKGAIEQYVRVIDPAAIPKKRNPFGNGQAPRNQEELQRMIEQMSKQQEHDDHGGRPEMPEMPEMPMPMPMEMPDQIPQPGADDDGTH